MAVLEPLTRKEMFYDAILGNISTSNLPEPVTREEIYLKDIAENGGGGGTTVIGNPSTEATEELDKIKIGSKTYSIPEGGTGTEVVANPEGEATDELDKVQIGEDIYSIPQGGGSADLTSDLTASVTVGGVTSGTTFEEGTPLENVVRNILSPTLYPSFTNPSASMSATGAKLIEKGGSLAVVFTITFNRGTINPAYGTSGYRAGAATDYTLDGTTQSGNTFEKTITEAKTSYTGSVAYAQGEQPKDSNGNNYDSPLPAGSANTNAVTYEFVNAIWANTTNISTVAKLSLVSKSAKQRDMTFPAQTVANPEIFDIPASWTVTAVQVKNDLSGQWEDASSQFTVTDTTHNDAGGVSTAYKRYTFNMGVGTGSRQIRVKWN